MRSSRLRYIVLRRIWLTVLCGAGRLAGWVNLSGRRTARLRGSLRFARYDVRSTVYGLLDLLRAGYTCPNAKEPVSSSILRFAACCSYQCAMATPSTLPDNPFVDPSSEEEELAADHAFAANSTLPVGKNASLTLGTDSLIVLGEHSRCGSNPIY